MNTKWQKTSRETEGCLNRDRYSPFLAFLWEKLANQHLMGLSFCCNIAISLKYVKYDWTLKQEVKMSRCDQIVWNVAFDLFVARIEYTPLCSSKQSLELCQVYSWFPGRLWLQCNWKGKFFSNIRFDSDFATTLSRAHYQLVSVFSISSGTSLFSHSIVSMKLWQMIGMQDNSNLIFFGYRMIKKYMQWFFCGNTAAMKDKECNLFP